MDERCVNPPGGKLEEFFRREESMCEVGKASCLSENLFTVVEGRVAEHAVA